MDETVIEQKVVYVIELTDAQLDMIAERAAERAAQKALKHVYAEVGQHVLKKLALLAGACVVGLALWLSGKGLLQ